MARGDAMLAVFCLRLGIGMLAVLLILPRAQVHPRFYRTHFLIALGLSGLALWGAWSAGTALMLGLIGAAAALAFLAAVVWSLEGAPGGRTLIVVTCAALVAALVFIEKGTPSGEAEAPLPSLLVGDLTSAALLGSALTAMLLGHSYLIAPGMSMTPMYRLLTAFGVAVLVRVAADGYGLWRWTSAHSLGTLNNDDLLCLPVRWLVGFILPLVLGWMAWQTARIRSTQSATGILYVVVILCFLGELTSQLLREKWMTL
jgi:hypothetical protein